MNDPTDRSVADEKTVRGFGSDLSIMVGGSIVLLPRTCQGFDGKSVYIHAYILTSTSRPR